MRKKYCPRCNMTSFSAYKEVWICPYCREDMSNQPDYCINDDTHETNAIRAGEPEDKKAGQELFGFILPHRNTL